MDPFIPFDFVEEESVAVPIQNRRDGSRNDLRHDLASARAGQTVWAALSPRGRVPYFRRLRHELVMKSKELAYESGNLRGRPTAESLTAEVLPLLEACRHLERSMERLLASRRPGRRGRPLWLTGVSVEVRREPVGVVLVVGPSNYPLFLPAVQALQALAAGNAVLIKAAPGTSSALTIFFQCLLKAGFDHSLVHMVTEDAATVETLLRMGVNKVVLTGSAATGRAVLHQCAETLTPANMELSGSDPVFIRADADVDLAARALAFGLRLNGGATCIAPRRVFVHENVARAVEKKLAELLSRETLKPLPLLVRDKCLPLITDALSQESRLINGAISADGKVMAPVVISAAHPDIRLLQEEVFAPILTLMAVSGDDEAVNLARRSPHALGASIFTGDSVAAGELAGRLNAGVVTINDLIATTADPRICFGGRGESGFGVTRGDEGLLEMTVIKSISHRSGRWRPHYDPPQGRQAELFAAWAEAVHGRGLGRRFRALIRLCKLGAAAPRNGNVEA